MHDSYILIAWSTFILGILLRYFNVCNGFQTGLKKIWFLCAELNTLFLFFIEEFFINIVFNQLLLLENLGFLITLTTSIFENSLQYLKKSFLFDLKNLFKFSICAEPNAAFKFGILKLYPTASWIYSQRWLTFAVVERCFIFFANNLLLVIIAPPPPVVNILLPLKLKHPTRPKVPACLLLKKLPNASAASSITIKLYFFAIFKILSILQILPNTWTGIIALILFLVFLLK